MKNCQSAKHNKQNGFSLLEVIIALVVSNIALLGLVAGELKSLQYANNSYQYTVALIQANNVVERVFNDVCTLKTTPSKFDADYVQNDLALLNNKYALTFSDMSAGFSENFNVYVSWDDKRMDDNNLNKVAVKASYPTVKSGCSVNG
ncbi:prepilin-type N-terminal cleavage/methylation domain-containing protein [Psychromonas sp.]|nr:prepilin-type N-terminal cleavage/methylation domain-containing protein [Psychromonas sp.]